MKAYGFGERGTDDLEFKPFFKKRQRKVYKRFARRLKKAARRSWKEEVTQTVQ